MAKVTITRDSLIALAQVQRNLAYAMLLAVELQQGLADGARDPALSEARSHALYAMIAEAEEGVSKQIGPLIARLSLTPVSGTD